MNEQELNALIAILNRAPMTPGEALWLGALIERLRAQLAAAAAKAADK